MNITINEINNINNSISTIKNINSPENNDSIYHICSEIDKVINNIEVWSNEVTTGNQIKEELIRIKKKLLSVAESTKTLNEHINIYALNELDRLKRQEGASNE